MKNYIIGAVIGALMVLGTTAFASTTIIRTLTKVDSATLSNGNGFDKIFDSNANVICYVAYGIGISCLKNN